MVLQYHPREYVPSISTSTYQYSRISILTQGKLAPRSEPGVDIGTGYQHGKSGFLVWLPQRRKSIVAEHVTFDEAFLPSRRDPSVAEVQIPDGTSVPVH